MHILSLSDIQLIVDLFETQRELSDVSGRERQIDSLIRTGYLRPLRGTYMLTELGEKTARSLQARRFVPSRSGDATATAPALAHAASDTDPSAAAADEASAAETAAA